MKTAMAISSRLILPSCLVVLAILGSAVGQSNPIRTVIQSRLALSNNDFAFDLYRKIAKASPGSNVLLSPAGISLTLALVYVGAKGKTKSQLATAMHLSNYSSTDEPINEGFKSLVQALSRLDNAYALQMANRLYAQSGRPFRSEYLSTTDEYYRTSLETLDFRGDPSAATGTINNWVEKVTSRKFNELLPATSITSRTSLVLVSAVDLRASWLYKFDRRATSPQTFYLATTKETKVEMMNMPRAFGLRYTESVELECHVLELPYEGDEISMFVFLPSKTEGLSSLEDQLGATTLDRVLRAVKDVPTMQVSMPKFVLQQQIDLKKALQAVGVTDLFDPNVADLSGIDGARALVLSNAVHKANLEVNEEGSDGDAALGVVAFPATVLPATINFIVNKPFLLLLMEKTTGSILYVGRVMNPPQSI